MSKMLEILNPDFSFLDERGSFWQLCHEGWSQVNVSTTKAGTFRGGHFHKKSTEAFFIVNGDVDVTVERDDKTENYSFKTGDFFTVYPYAIHSFNFNADTVMVALYDIPVVKDDGSKDIYDKGE